MPYPGAADFFFQMVFAATAATIVSGAIGGRMKFGAYLVFALVMTAVIYPLPRQLALGRRLARADGLLRLRRVLGRARRRRLRRPGRGAGRRPAHRALRGPRIVAMPGHNLPLAGVGVFLLWIGWFGFNGGSQLVFSSAADAQAIATVFLNTNLGAAGGAFAALFLSWAIFKKPDFSMTLNGVIAGLVSITAGPDVINGIWAVVAGAIGGVLVTYSILLLDRLKIDDPVGAISAHGTAGIWGTLAVGVFGGANLLTQLLGTLAYAGAGVRRQLRAVPGPQGGHGPARLGPRGGHRPRRRRARRPRVRQRRLAQRPRPAGRGRLNPRRPRMKLITAIVRPDRLPAVKEALFKAGVRGITISRVSGHGGQAGIAEQYRGAQFVVEFREKIELKIAVSEGFVQPTIDAIVAAARTGNVGDGKIFVQPLERVVRIRTGEEDTEALTPVGA
jgi:nitrogen regulatory protein PII